MASAAEQHVLDQSLRFAWPTVRPQRDEDIGGPHHRQRGLGNIKFVFDVQPPQNGWQLQAVEALEQQVFSRIGGLAGGFGMPLGSDSEEQPCNMAFEHLGDLGDGSQTCIVPRAPTLAHFAFAYWVFRGKTTSWVDEAPRP
jgi:hypothetical protein